MFTEKLSILYYHLFQQMQPAPSISAIQREIFWYFADRAASQYIYLNINQLDALNFIMTLCFEHHVLIVRRSQLYYTASGIMTPIGGRPLHTPVQGR